MPLRDKKPGLRAGLLSFAPSAGGASPSPGLIRAEAGLVQGIEELEDGPLVRWREVGDLLHPFEEPGGLR